MRHVLITGALLGGLFGAAHIGAAKSERAHRALDMQYQRCLDRGGTREQFRTCLWGQK